MQAIQLQEEEEASLVEVVQAEDSQEEGGSHLGHLVVEVGIAAQGIQEVQGSRLGHLFRVAFVRRLGIQASHQQWLVRMGEHALISN